MIEIEDLHKSFGDNYILRGVNLSVNRGESKVVIGGSGSGKSVLLKHIIGLLKPDRGRIVIAGKDLASLLDEELIEVRKKIGMVFQAGALFDSMTVGENVGFFLHENTRLSKKVIREKVREKLDLVGLEGVGDLKPAELSGGMKKRAALARALASEPEIILYDEPTTGLDPIRADSINNLIIEMKKKLKVTSITITHDLVSAYKIADRIAMLYNGRIIFVGTPAEMQQTSDPIVRQFITGSAEGPISLH